MGAAPTATSPPVGITIPDATWNAVLPVVGSGSHAGVGGKEGLRRRGAHPLRGAPLPFFSYELSCAIDD